MKAKLINILLVEDNPDDVELCLKAFEKNRLKNKIYVVRDGQEALDYLYHQGQYAQPHKAPRPGLILLDIKLPKVDGIEVLRILKNDPQFKRIPIVILTTSKREQDILQSYDSGANSYIIKPVEFDKFLEIICQIRLYWGLINTWPQ